MVTLDEFKVSFMGDYTKGSRIATTIDQLAGDATAKEIINQALEIRTICEKPLVYEGKPIVPKTIEVIIGSFEDSLYVFGIKMGYINNRTKEIQQKYLNYADFIMIAETKKRLTG